MGGLVADAPEVLTNDMPENIQEGQMYYARWSDVDNLPTL